MAAEGMYFFLHAALVDIKLSLQHLQCSLFIMLMSISSHWAPLCLSSLIGMKTLSHYQHHFFRLLKQPGVKGNILWQTRLNDNTVRRVD